MARWLPHLQRSADLIPPSISKPLQLCAGGKSAWPLVLTGPAGTGKTRAALCTLDWTSGDTAYYVLEQLCDDLIRAMSGSWDQESRAGHGGVVQTHHIWDDWGCANLAVVDEIGSRSKVSDHRYETLKRAIDSREDRPLVVISNVGLEELALLYDDRIASRLAGGTVAVCEGTDMRLT